MTDEPTPNGTHDAAGRFVRGNSGGPGNPHGGTVAKLRSAMLQAITEGDVQAIIAKLVDQARDGDIKAATLLLGYVGKPVATEEPASSPDRAAAILAIGERIKQSRLLAAHEVTG